MFHFTSPDSLYQLGTKCSSSFVSLGTYSFLRTHRSVVKSGLWGVIGPKFGSNLFKMASNTLSNNGHLSYIPSCKTPRCSPRRPISGHELANLFHRVLEMDMSRSSGSCNSIIHFFRNDHQLQRSLANSVMRVFTFTFYISVTSIYAKLFSDAFTLARIMQVSS